MGVGPHVVEDQPVADFGSRKLRFTLIADLVEAIASRSEHRGRHQLVDVIVFFLADRVCQSLRHRVEVVIHHVVERPIHSIVDVKGLLGALPTLAAIHFCRNSR